MARSKPGRKSSDNHRASPSGVHHQWLWIMLVTGLVVGGLSGYFVGRANVEPGITVDRYGRTVTDAHFNHDHP